MVLTLVSGAVERIWIKPAVNLAAKYPSLGPAEWIVPLTESLEAVLKTG